MKNKEICASWAKEAGKTWKLTDSRQKIHYSQQKVDGKPGAHSETIDVERFMEFYKTISHLNLDIMLEVKDKNLSVIKCMNAVDEFMSCRPRSKV